MEHIARIKLQERIDEFDYDFANFTVESFVKWVATRRNRPIIIHPMSLPSELFGAWIRAKQADYIFYDDGPFRLHATHILLHELSHVLLNHQTAPLETELSRWLEQGLASSDPLQTQAAVATVQGLFRTISYTDWQELEAETLSSLIQSRIFQLAGLNALTKPTQHLGMRQFVEHLGLDR